MGVEVNTARVWARAEALELSRVVFVNMLDRERADFYRTLAAVQEQLSDRCVAIQLPIGQRARADAASSTCCTTAPTWIPQAAARAIPWRSRTRWRSVAAEYREKLLDAVVETDEALMERYLARRGARPARGRRGAEDRRDERRALSRRLRRRDEEPRHPRAARPARRGRALAGAQAHAASTPAAAPSAFVFKTVADPFAGRISSSASTAARSAPTRRSSTCATRPRSGSAA